MLTSNARVTAAVDNETIGFLTAVDRDGQPQTSPVWYVREGDHLIVYNKAETPRLASIDANPRVSFNLRGDAQGVGAILLEGTAARATELGPSYENPRYVEKYHEEMARIGWTPRTFHDDYPVPIRITITRVRSWGLEVFDQPDR